MEDPVPVKHLKRLFQNESFLSLFGLYGGLRVLRFIIVSSNTFGVLWVIFDNISRVFFDLI